MKFSDIINANLAHYSFIISVGDDCTFLARNGRGINYFEPDQLAWLDSHKPLHVIYEDFRPNPRIKIIYRRSQTFHDLMWGDGK